MNTIPYFMISKTEIGKDYALKIGSRGARKLLVTDLYKEKEMPANSVAWTAPAENSKCDVQIMPDTELAVFTQVADQDRHFHKQGTEIYIVLEGQMAIEIEEKTHLLSVGDTIIINPMTVHEVKPENTNFICQVVTINCGGASDKYVVDGGSHDQ